MITFYSLVNENGEMVLSGVSTDPDSFNISEYPVGYRLLRDVAPRAGVDYDEGLYYCEKVAITPPDATEILYVIKELNIEDIMDSVRAKRDMLLNEVLWRVERYQRLERLNLPQMDDIGILDNYIQDLCDITKQPGFPKSVIFPSEIDKTPVKHIP